MAKEKLSAVIAAKQTGLIHGVFLLVQNEAVPLKAPRRHNLRR